MKKFLALVSLISVMACGGQAAVKPEAPPAIAPQELKSTPAIVVSDTMTEYKGDTWSVSFPSSFQKQESNDHEVDAALADGSAILFMKEAGTDSTDSVASGIVVNLLLKGISSSIISDGKVEQWDAKEIAYGDPKNALIIVVFATGTNAYSLMYRGTFVKDRKVMFEKVLGSIHVTDVPVVVEQKPEPKKTTPKK